MKNRQKMGRTVETKRNAKGESDVDKLGPVFRKHGYDASSLSIIQKATGMSKSSLYYKFPNGKSQMVEEVIEARGEWLRDNVFVPLRDDRQPATRIKEMFGFVDQHYEHGISACLLGVLALSDSATQYSAGLSEIFREWIEALSVPLKDGGVDEPAAIELSQDCILRIQGGLIVSRALDSNHPFVNALEHSREDLLTAIAK